jgi:hypothetical protein
MSARHFVKYTFLKLDPAWRRLEEGQREQDKREFNAACEDFADGHLLQAFSLVGEPRPDPRAARRAGAERADEVGANPLLVPGDEEKLGVLR